MCSETEVVHDLPPPPTRERLFAAADRLLQEVRPKDVLPGVRAVCREADLPTGSFYHSFSGSEDFHRDLLSWLSERDRTPVVAAELEGSLQEFGTWVKDTTPDGPAMSGALASLIGRHVANFRSNAQDSFRIQLLLSAILKEGDEASREDEEFTQAFRETYGRTYQHIEDHDAAGYQAFLDALGMKLRPPFDVRSVTAVLVAIFDGLTIRAMLLPDSDVQTLLEDSVRVIISCLLCSVDEEEDYDIDQMVADTLNRNASSGPPPLTTLRSA
jgi:AcrR family transcriptional regulator